jgi:hypothetical protein
VILLSSAIKTNGGGKNRFDYKSRGISIDRIIEGL